MWQHILYLKRRPKYIYSLFKLYFNLRLCRQLSSKIILDLYCLILFVLSVLFYQYSETLLFSGIPGTFPKNNIYTFRSAPLTYRKNQQNFLYLFRAALIYTFHHSCKFPLSATHFAFWHKSVFE